MTLRKIFFVCLLALTVISTPIYADPTPAGRTTLDEESTKTVRVPDVVGLTRREAIDALLNAGLQIGDVREESDPSAPPYRVIRESPAAATKARVNSKVDIFVAQGKEVRVPDVLGLTLGAAKAVIDKVGLEVGRIEERPSPTATAGLIISQHPRAGTAVREDRRIHLVVSTGTFQETVPNVVGFSQAAATTAITGASLTVGTVAMQSSATVAAGLVVSESPPSGISVTSGSAVNLVISNGQPLVTVPNVIGLAQATATKAITSASLINGTITTVSSATVALGLVISESPAAGIRVVSGSSVSLVVSSGVSKVAVPNVVGLTQVAATTAITGAGLSVGTATMQSSTTVAAGLVISEAPAAGASVAPGSAVNLVVSSGNSAVTPTIGAAVPSAASGLIAAIYSATATVSVGGAIPTLPDGSIPILFAGDGANDPLLLAVGTTSGELDADTTSIGIVRVALGLVYTPTPLTSGSIAAAIQSSPNYAALLSAVNGALANGDSPLDSQSVIQDAWVVANDATTSINSIPVSTLAKKLLAAPIDVNPPLPFYLINSSETTNQVFLNDIPGTANVNVMNRTFIAWQLNSSDPSGNSIDSEVAPPLTTTALQLLGSYSGGATTTVVMGASPNFNLALSQSTTTQAQNAINSYNRIFVFAFSTITGLYPDQPTNACIAAATGQVLNPNLATLLTQGTGTAANTYFASILPRSPLSFYTVFSKCGSLPTISQIFGQSINAIWRALNLARGITSTLGTVAETFNYWNYSQNFQICKVNNILASCSVRLQIVPLAGTLEFTVALQSMLPLYATATDSNGLPIAAPPNILWTSYNPGTASVDSTGTVTGVGSGVATITATDPVSGATASTSVTSYSPNSDVLFISGNGSGSETLTITVSPSTNCRTYQTTTFPVNAVPMTLPHNLPLDTPTGKLSGPWTSATVTVAGKNSVMESGEYSTGGMSTYLSTISPAGIVTTVETGLPRILVYDNTLTIDTQTVNSTETVNLSSGAYMFTRTQADATNNACSADNPAPDQVQTSTVTGTVAVGLNCNVTGQIQMCK